MPTVSTFLAVSLSALLAQLIRADDCNFDAIDRSLRDDYCDQPLFVTFTPNEDDLQLIDNTCHTYFPLPDDPDTFQIYISSVFCDGSHSVFTQISTQIQSGVARKATPFCTYTDYVLDYAGCDTYVIARCNEFGDCYDDVSIYGLSKTCHAIGLSCLHKVEEIISDAGLDEQEFYVLPMKLPNKCVTQQLCLAPPNPFYNELPRLVTVPDQFLGYHNKVF